MARQPNSGRAEDFVMGHASAVGGCRMAKEEGNKRTERGVVSPEVSLKADANQFLN
jgi:hypothetical protein